MATWTPWMNVGGDFEPQLLFEGSDKLVLSSTAQTVSETFEAEADSNYIIVMDVDDHYGDYDYAYYTYGTASIVQDVGTVTNLTPNASESGHYQVTYTSAQVSACKHRTFIFSLVASASGTVTMQYAGVAGSQYSAQCSVNYRVVKL